MSSDYVSFDGLRIATGVYIDDAGVVRFTREGVNIDYEIEKAIEQYLSDNYEIKLRPNDVLGREVLDIVRVTLVPRLKMKDDEQ